MKRGSIACALVGVLGLVMLASCGSTKMAGAWKEPTFSGGPFKKVMVVGIAKQEGRRRIFETEFANALKAHGVEAFSSGSHFSGSDQLAEDAVAAKLTELGCDGVLVTRLIDQKTETSYHSGSSYAVPHAYYRGYYPYYSSSYTMMYSPGYTVENTTVSLETNLYWVSSGKLIWSGLTDTLLSGDLLKDIGDVIKVLVNEMAKEKLVE